MGKRERRLKGRADESVQRGERRVAHKDGYIGGEEGFAGGVWRWCCMSGTQLYDLCSCGKLLEPR